MKIPFGILDDGLDDDSLLDDQGYPVEMDSAKKESIEDSEYEERLKRAVADTQAFLAIGGWL